MSLAVEAPRCVPVVRAEPAWDDPQAVRALIESRGPFPTTIHFEDYGTTLGETTTLPWFRERWAVDGTAEFTAAEPVLRNPHFVAAAKRASGARVVRPQSLIVNLMGAQPAGPAHTDAPAFRGLRRGETPTLLLVLMGASGLFRRWAIPIASAISWWYEGPAGDFEYWPLGLGSPAEVERAPFGNVAIVGDNDTMFHRVGAIGRPEDIVPAGTFGIRAELHLQADGSAAVVEGGERRWHYAPGALRLSLLWKAHSFADERDAAVFDERSDDLDAERVLGVFADDLARRGIAVAEPSHPFRDPAWLAAIARAYPLQRPY
jgi:hypothetical protein